VPATVGLLVLRTPIIRILFERGRFTALDTAATADALTGYAVGLVGFATARIAAQAFYAVRQPGIAVRVGVLAIGVNIVAAVGLMGVVGHPGLAYASSVGAYVNVLALVWLARRRFGPLGGRALVTSILRALAASVPVAVWCALGAVLLTPRRGLALDAALLLTVIAGGAVIFWLASVAVRSPERTALERMLPGRRSR
jgi:putative peptidoglycan lipid II flippase